MADTLIIPGKRAGEISLGRPIDVVEKKWGEGKIVPKENFQIYSFPKKLFDLGVQKDVVIMILLRNPAYRTAEGIAVGTEVSRIIRVFGKDYEYERVKSKDTDYILNYWEKGIAFSIKRDYIKKIKIFNQNYTHDLYRKENR